MQRGEEPTSDVAGTRGRRHFNNASGSISSGSGAGIGRSVRTRSSTSLGVSVRDFAGPDGRPDAVLGKRSWRQEAPEETTPMK